MIRLRALYLLTSLIVCSTPFIVKAQCPQVEAMLVNACGTEQLNEFLIINSGGGFNTTDIIINYDANNNIISPQNNDVNTNVNNVAPGTPCGIAAGNIGAYTGCSNLISIGDGFIVPPNSIVIFQTSLGSTSSYNFSSLCGAGQCVYVVSSGCTRTAGAFTNAGGGTRTTVFDIAGSGCASQTITYTLGSVANVDGAYYLPLTNTYGSAGCVVPPSSPAPAGSTVNQPANVSVCANDAVNVPFTGTGSSYDWTNSNINIGLGANGTGDISFTAANVASTQTGTITVTPSGSCPGPAQTFTITVNPAPNMNVPADITVCAGAVVNVPFSGGGGGTTYSWTNDNPAVGLGVSGNGNINFTSANVANQEVATITVTPQNGTCPGPPVTVTITVNPRPTVDDPANLSVCGGDPVNVVFTGTGSPNYSWTNSNASIGLGTSGTGDINFTAANVGGITTGIITVTPSIAGCTGPSQLFNISVNPAPTVNQPLNVVRCGGAVVAVNFSGSPAGTTFNWTNDNTSIGLGASGSGNLNFTSSNSANQEIATITVTPQLGACPGTPRTFTITINQTPTVDDPPNQSVCGGDPVDVMFTGTGSPTFNWTNSNPSIGLAGSGNGDISIIAANVNAITTGTITVTPTIGLCVGTPQNFTITVNPTPTANQPNDVTVCSGAPVNVNFGGTPAGNIYNWTNDNPNIGLGISGAGNISFTSASVANQEIANITLTPQFGICPGVPRTFTITINPTPVLTDPLDQAVCASDPVVINFVATGNPTLNWTNSNTAIGLGASGTGNINFNAANVATTQTGTITVTPNSGGCPGLPQTFTVTVAPIPSANQPANVTVCAGAPVNVTFAGTPVGVTYSWTNDNPAVGLGASGIGNISFTSANVATQQIANITVTPQFGTCPGVPRTFTITINPTPVLTDPLDQAVCAGDPVVVNFVATGNPTLNWTNSNTAIGLGASGTGDINFNAANVATTQTGTITVTPNASGCPGTPQTFTVTVAPIPTANQPANVVVCAGAPVNVAFAGTPVGVTYSWTNDNPAVGLGASGTGNISFTSANVTTQQIANITVTPQFGTCPGVPRTFTITINPTPVLTDPLDQAVCAGDPVVVNFAATGNPTLNWTNSNTVIGLGASGTGNINFNTANVATTQTGTITVTPIASGCPGTPQSFTVTVAPIPTANQPANVVVCAGSPVNVAFAGTPVGVTYSWTNDNPAVGLGASGTGNISFTSANVATQQIANITVTPQFGTCPGVPRTFTITINPTPVLTDPLDQAVCAGDPVVVNFAATGNPTLNWTNSNTVIGLGASGTGNINFNTANVATTQTGTITVTPNASGCPGTPQTFTVTVAPIPTANQPANVIVCAGAPVNVTFAGTPVGVTYSWTNDNPAVGLGASGNGNISFTSANVATQQIANITVTPQFGTCPGVPRTFTITINPSATLNQPADVLVCGGQPVNVNFTGTAGATFNWTNSNTATGLGASGSGNISYTSPNVASTTTGVVTVTPTANGCPGTPLSFSITIESQPTAIAPVDQIICGNQAVNIALSGSAGSFNWTNSNPAIGLAASGTGNLVFTSADVVNPQTAVITITPQIGTCTGTTVQFNITVNPTPQISQPADLQVCAANVLQIDFSANQTGTSFNWTNDNTGIGLGASGNGSIMFTAANVAAPLVGNISVTPVLGTCNGVPQTFAITVQPAATMTNPGDQNVCGGNVLNVNFVGAAGTIFNWTNNNPAIGLGASGNGNISFTAANVAGPTTGTISVTPVNGTCTGPTQTFNITVVTVPTVTNPGITNACANTPVAVTFGTGNTVYNWTNNNPAIGLAASGTGNLSFIGANVTAVETAQITVTPQIGTCTGVAEVFTININPAPVATITGVTTLCSGDGTTLTANGGTSYNWSGGQMSNSITVVPNATTNYAVIVSDAVGCTALANTTVTVNPLNITNLSASSCNPLDTGVVVTNFFNQFGCDSTVILTTQFLPSNTVNLSGVTCNPANAGVFTQNLTNIFGCDSTVINTITFDPTNIDTTILSATTCIPANAVPTQVLLVGVDGCDSLVITNTTLLPSNTINLSAVTCKPAEAGVFTQNLTNIFGCDSTVTTTVVFDPSLIDTTFLNAKTCLPGQVGQVAQIFLGVNGCDSILITNRTLAPSYALAFSTITCKPNEAGVFTQTLVSIDGCDSIRTTTVVFDPSLIDSTFLTAVTCNAAQVGIAQIILSGSNGCDSVVITNTTLAPPITNTVNVFTCKPNNAGTFIDTYNINGCDSVVTRIVVFDPTQLDTTQITGTTCDQTQAGQIIETLLGIDDCDSVVVRITVYDPTLCAPSGVISSIPTTCADNDDGQVTVLINSGLPPFQYNWIDGQGNSGSGTTAGLNTAFQIPGLAAGAFSITITQTTGPTLTLQSIVTAPPALSVLATSLQSFNGFGVRCAGDTDGAATASVSGGTGPYQYLWSNGDTLAAASNLGEGDYTVTITDKNGCPAVGTTSLNAPDPLRFILAVDRPDCGEQVADVAITPLGGVQLYDVFLDGNLVSGTIPSIGSGIHNIVVQDANDCIADSTFSLVVPESGVISLPSDTVVQLGQVLIIEAQTNLDVWRSISWSPLADTSCANCLTQTWIPFSSGIYTVTQVDTFGCVSKATIRVIVKKTSPVYVPNVFSPDNRNDNDLFTIGAGPSVLRMEELRIFDRWGNVVYILDTPIGPNEWPGWDGRVGGKEVGVGVYVYYLKVRLVDGTIELIKGDLTVIQN